MADGGAKGILYVIAGASGVGKGTVISRVLRNMKDIKYSISCTTRAPREGEQDGRDYYFISQKKFYEMIDNDMFLEHAVYVDNCYGTPKKPIIDALEEGKDVFLEIEMQGAFKVKSSMPQAVMIFIVAPEIEELEKRIRNRSTESEDKILKRLEVARIEYDKARSFDYIIVNDEVGNAVNELISIVTAERCKINRRENYLNIK